MAKYRKKTVVIDAVQIATEIGSLSEYPDWANEAIEQRVLHKVHKVLPGSDEIVFAGWQVFTLEDGPNGEAKHYGRLGDWIIRGEAGKLYFCKPDIFAATYELAE